MKKICCILICFCILLLTVSCSIVSDNELTIKDIENMLTDTTIFELKTDISFSDITYKRYQQICQNIPVFNSSIIDITDNKGNTQLVGEYYDFSISDEKKFANIDVSPDWLKKYKNDEISVVPDTNSVSATIYITDSNDAVPALSFTVRIFDKEKISDFLLVTSLDGEKVYFYEPFFNSFENGVVSNGNEHLDVIYNENLYYAACENHYYYVWNQKLTEQKDVEKDITKKGFLFDKNEILKTSHTDWSTGYFNIVFDAMNVMNDVEDFWSSEYSYYGIDGNKNYGKLIILDSYIAGTAQCGGNYSIILGMTPDGKYSAADAPEIVAHEFTHGVLKNYCGLINTNESGALHEAISDVFGVVFSNNKNWKLAENFSCYNISKDIASENKTMDDFEYDNYLIDLRFYNLGKLLKIGEQSNKFVHSNSYIISHMLYEIASNIFDNDLKFFGQIMFNSLKYISYDSGFSEFRNAFEASVKELCGNRTAEECAKYFEKVGIESGNEFFIITKIGTIVGVPNTENVHIESISSNLGTDNEKQTDDYNKHNVAFYNLYKDYFYQHYDENDTVCLVDLTHDSIDDMLVFSYSSDDNVGAEIHLFTATDGEVKEIYSRGLHNFRTKIFLTASKGICNMIVYENAVFQGIGSLNNSEIYFSESGEITEISSIVQEIAPGDDVDEKQEKYDSKIKNLYGKNYSDVYLFPTGDHDEHELMFETNPVIVFNGKPDNTNEEVTEKKDIFGTWLCDIDAFGEKLTLIITFSEDGSVEYKYGFKNSELIETYTGSWEKSSNHITLNMKGRSWDEQEPEIAKIYDFYGTYGWTIQNNNLILEYVEGKLLFVNEKDTTFVFNPEQV